MCTKERVLATSSTVGHHVPTKLPQRLADLCHVVIYDNILKLYTDKVYGKIRMGCKDIYQKNNLLTKQITCNQVKHFGAVGGYSFSYSERLEDNTIVMCSTFFAPGQALLEPLIKSLRKNKSSQKDPRQMTGKTRMLLHEIAHLAAISETPDRTRLQLSPLLSHMLLTGKTVIVIDQKLRPEGNSPIPAYGPVRVQKMGMHEFESVRARTQRNGMWSCRLKNTGCPVLTSLRSGFLRDVRFMEVLRGPVRNA
jgi:hypothetical protein